MQALHGRVARACAPRDWRCSRPTPAPAVAARAPRARPLRVRRSHAAHHEGAQQQQQPIQDGPPEPAALQPLPEGGSVLPAAPGGGDGQAKVAVQFVVPEYMTHWGQVLKVVGSLEELGNWKVEKAPSMEWRDGHTWTLDVQLPVGAVNFKVVMQEAHGGVRWEQGSDRSVLIPETTSVSGAPVGQVGVTCDFDDVANSRVEVRPDRRYLRQQLKAVEARVSAIQEKKRKLDQRMSALTEGLRKYDQTVALLEDGVQEAIRVRQRSTAEAPQLGGQQQGPEGAAASDASAEMQQQQQPAVAAADQAASAERPRGWSGGASGVGGGSIQVPILSPDELPSFDDLSVSSLSSTEEGRFAPPQQPQQQQPGLHDAGPSPAAGAPAPGPGELAPAPLLGLAPGISAIKQSHVNETVLSATVDQLLAAAEDALARSGGGGGGGGGGGAAGAAQPQQGSAGVDDSALAEEYVEELLAAASALEQQADQRASLLLEAAKQAGDSAIAADIEQLAAAPVPEMPSPEELSEAAAEEAARLAAAEAAAAASAEAEAAAKQQEQQQQQQAPGAQPQARPAALTVNGDGTITFSAESLSVDVDANELLAAVMSRVGIPLESMGAVTISATITPAAVAAPAEPPAGAAPARAAPEAEAAAPPHVGPHTPAGKQQEQQEQQQGTGEEGEGGAQAPGKQHASPADAIAAVFSSAAAAAASGDRENGAVRGAWAERRSSRGGGRSPPAHPAAVPPARASVLEAERQLAAKEAARRAAAERVAAALAQVEEMRHNVVAANDALAQQLRGGPGGEATPAAASSGAAGGYSRYRVAFKADRADAGAAGGAPTSRAMPTVGAAAVVPRRDGAGDAPGEAAAGEAQPVQGAVREGLLALAALAASVSQSAASTEAQEPEQEEF